MITHTVTSFKHVPFPARPLQRLTGTLMLTALAAVCAPAWADLPVFTLDPAQAGPPLAGSAVIADNLVLSNRSHVTIDAGTGDFIQTGMLSVQTLQLLGSVNASPGLNSSYGLYLAFEAEGTSTPGNLLTDFTHGAFTSFNYTLYGFNGPPATFEFDAANNPVNNAVGAFSLGSGSLIQGSISTSPALNGGNTPAFVPSSNVTLSFAVTPGQEGFFDSPSPFYDTAFMSFTNTVSQVESISGSEYRIRQGGGALNFATAVPEPETYALMMAGLGILGFLGRRRGLTRGH